MRNEAGQCSDDVPALLHPMTHHRHAIVISIPLSRCNTTNSQGSYIELCFQCCSHAQCHVQHLEDTGTTWKSCERLGGGEARQGLGCSNIVCADPCFTLSRQNGNYDCELAVASTLSMHNSASTLCHPHHTQIWSGMRLQQLVGHACPPSSPQAVGLVHFRMCHLPCGRGPHPPLTSQLEGAWLDSVPLFWLPCLVLQRLSHNKHWSSSCRCATSKACRAHWWELKKCPEAPLRWDGGGEGGWDCILTSCSCVSAG